MSRRLTIALGLMAALAPAAPAGAQMMYPGGYGGYGMSKWGADPGAGYMAGLGAYARGQGVYEEEKAKADAINVVTMVKWNQALRERQARLRKEKAEEKAKLDAALVARATRQEDEDGTTLNSLLMQVLDSDPGVVRASRVSTPLSPEAIREIPFEWDSEAITVCLDQMTGQGSMPGMLMDARYETERSALRSAMSQALAEDMKGPLSQDTLARVRDSVAKFRAGFEKKTDNYELGYGDAKAYLTTLDSLARLLDDPSMKAFLKQLEDGKQRTVGDLIAFMNAFNLRFGTPASQRQTQIYTRLVPAFQAVRDAAVAARTVAQAPADPDGAQLRSAAKDAFKGMTPKDLEAHGRNP